MTHDQALAQLRHLYWNMVNGHVHDAAEAARGLLGPAIACIEGSGTYDPMPPDRRHACHAVNAAGIPVDWLDYEPKHGFELCSTDAYGGGSVVSVNYCPWCGLLLATAEVLAGVQGSGERNRGGIRVTP